LNEPLTLLSLTLISIFFTFYHIFIERRTPHRLLLSVMTFIIALATNLAWFNPAIVTDTGEIVILEQYRWMGAFMSLFTYINFLFIFYYLFIWMREVHRE